MGTSSGLGARSGAALSGRSTSVRTRCSPARALEIFFCLFVPCYLSAAADEMAPSLSLVDAGTNIQTNEEVAIKLVRALWLRDCQQMFVTFY